MQMRAYDENRSVYRSAILRNPKWKASPIPYYLQKRKKVSLVSDVAGDNFELEPRSGVGSEQSREDRRFFKRGMKFSMEAN